MGSEMCIRDSWYNFIIQHNPTPNKGRAGYDAKNGRGNAHINPNRDRQHGRIYRVVYEEHDSKAPKLGNSKQLVTALGHDNLFWRQTAQRLLVDGKRTDAVPALKTLTTKGGHGAIHALWALSGIGALDTKTHTAALISPEPALRRNAIRALGADKFSAQMLYDSATLADKNLQVRLVAFTKLAALPESDDNKKTASLLMKLPENAKDEWLRLALINTSSTCDTKQSSTQASNGRCASSIKPLSSPPIRRAWPPASTRPVTLCCAAVTLNSHSPAYSMTNKYNPITPIIALA